MSANTNISVRSGHQLKPLIEIDAKRTGRNPLASSTEQRKHHMSAAARRNDRRDRRGNA